MIVVDTSVWVDYFNGVVSVHTDFLDRVLGTEPVGVGDLILAEVLQGFRTAGGYRKGKSLMMELPVFEMAGAERAIRAAANYRFLRSQGVTVRKTIDTLIASFCIEQSLPLLFIDRDFEPFVQHLGLRAALPPD